MPISLLRTKLYVPPLRPEVLKRSRLVQRLKEAIHYKLTLVSAPAGFGKTTLVSSWLKEERISAAWLSVDQADNDPVRFWIYFISAIQTIEENIGRNFLAILDSAQSPPFETLLSELINEIVESQTRIVFVLDDYHLIVNQQVQDTLLFLLEHLPFRMHFVIISRIDPPWPLARLRASREISELRAENLRFTLEETSIFLKDAMELDISQDEVSVLEKRTEGWVVGLQMAALSMKNRTDISSFVSAFAGTHRYILDYLLEEVLEQQQTTTQTFLLKTSILDRMTAQLCDALLEGFGSQSTLTQLEKTNLFLVPLDDDRVWYRYHHLFSELLRNQLFITEPDIVPVLHQRASRWFDVQDFSEEAIGHAFKAKDYERVADLVEKYAQYMLHQSKYTTLFSWIEMIPTKLVQSRPWLCVYQAWTRHWAGRREGGEDCLLLAEKLLDKENLNTEGITTLRGYIAAVRAHYALIHEDIPRVIEQARKALRLLHDDHFARGTAAIALGGAYWGKGDVNRAEEAFAECASSALKGGYSYRASSALCYVGMQQVKQARLLDAESTFREALILAEDPEGRRFSGAGFPLAKLGELACEWNKLEQAHQYVAEGVKLCVQLGQVDLMAEAYVALARFQLVQKDILGVEDTLQKIEKLANETKLDPWAVSWLDDCRIRLWLNTDRLDEAIYWAETSELGVNEPFNYQHDLNHLNLARVLVARYAQDPFKPSMDIVFGLLNRLIYAAQKAGWVHHKIQALILKALAFNVVGDTVNAVDGLGRALWLAEPSSYMRVFLDEGTPLVDLLRNLQFKQGNHLGEGQCGSADYIDKLILAWENERGYPDGQSLLVESLTPREIEVLGLLATNKTVPEIADKLVLSANTVRTHVKHIYDKLDVNRRFGAVQKGKELNLI